MWDKTRESKHQLCMYKASSQNKCWHGIHHTSRDIKIWHGYHISCHIKRTDIMHHSMDTASISMESWHHVTAKVIIQWISYTNVYHHLAASNMPAYIWSVIPSTKDDFQALHMTFQVSVEFTTPALIIDLQQHACRDILMVCHMNATESTAWDILSNTFLLQHTPKADATPFSHKAISERYYQHTA